MAGILTGIARYQNHEWPLLRSLAADPDALEPTHQQWFATASRVFQDLQRRGMAVEWIDVRVADLVAWCQSQHRPLDEAARSAFVAHTIRNRPAPSPPPPPATPSEPS